MLVFVIVVVVLIVIIKVWSTLDLYNILTPSPSNNSINFELWPI